MVALREVRKTLLLAHSENNLNDEEFLLLYDLNQSKNLDFPYWRYTSFDLDRLNEDECIANFRFKKNDIYHVQNLLEIPIMSFIITELKSMVLKHCVFF